MIHYAVLGSGSTGNSYLIGNGSEAILFDAGFSLRQLRIRSEEAGIDFSTVQGLCITHMHPDHCRGAGVFARKTGKPVFVHQSVAMECSRELSQLGIPEQLLHLFSDTETFSVGSFRVTAFRTSHDSPSSVGFTTEISRRNFTILTDTGVLDDTMRRFALDSDILFLEANYDDHMLDTGPYPRFLKMRIKGDFGHLSNNDAVGLLNNCESDRLRQVYFCHLSRTNNHPRVLESLCAEQLRWEGIRTICEHGQLYRGSVDPGDKLP